VPLGIRGLEDSQVSQTKLGSFAEASVSMAIGFGINFVANAFILPQFGFTSLTPLKNFTLGLLYTIISVVRSYGVRRLFNWVKFGNAP
jgi:hypothetical protein